jgi:DNA-directed RNA polymerase specialized sigma subunit
MLGVSESRACQIHSELRRALRETLAGDALLFAELL